jgi:hypothetical protein
MTSLVLPIRMERKRGPDRKMDEALSAGGPERSGLGVNAVGLAPLHRQPSAPSSGSCLPALHRAVQIERSIIKTTNALVRRLLIEAEGTHAPVMRPAPCRLRARYARQCPPGERLLRLHHGGRARCPGKVRRCPPGAPGARARCAGCPAGTPGAREVPGKGPRSARQDGARARATRAPTGRAGDAGISAFTALGHLPGSPRTRRGPSVAVAGDVGRMPRVPRRARSAPCRTSRLR